MLVLAAVQAMEYPPRRVEVAEQGQAATESAVPVVQERPALYQGFLLTMAAEEVTEFLAVMEE
jgi:hypothetical protein